MSRPQRATPPPLPPESSLEPKSGLRPSARPSLPEVPRRLADDVLERLWFGDDDPNHTHQMASATMAAHIATIAGLKPFPAVAQNVMGLLRKPGTTVKEIREAIERDPSLGSQLLRMANSAFYRRGRACGSIEEAVVRFGFGELQRLVAGIAAMGMFRDARGVGARFREHSVSVGAIAKVLADHLDDRMAPTAYLCGLLHDIGKLLSLQVGEIRYDDFPPDVIGEPDRTHLVERVSTGYDHAVLGAHVLGQWGLPDNVTETVAWHHQPVRAFGHVGEVPVLAGIVRLADRIEYLHHRCEVPTAVDLRALVADSAASYLDFDEARVAYLWPQIREAVLETSAFT